MCFLPRLEEPLTSDDEADTAAKLLSLSEVLVCNRHGKSTRVCFSD